jgi:4-amino-4-deoxy-L-arabinose transferase-like glycosyltransferase
MSPLKRYHRLLICGGAAAILYLAGLGRPALWEPDEGRYAEVAREMVVSGDYITPRDDRVRYLEKPPLDYWAGALAITILGRNEFAVRAPAAVVSAGSVIATAAMGEIMLGPVIGILSAIALGLSPLFFLFARLATPDPLLAFFFTAALGSFYVASRGDFHAGAGRRFMIAAAGFLALATLSKGPVALVLAGAIGVLWLTVDGRAKEILRIRWPECIAVYLALTMPWFVIAARRNPGFIEFFVLHEHVQRFLSNTEHSWGPWFFLVIAIAGTWPFCYFWPSGALRASFNRGEPAANRSAVRFLLIWFGIVLVFFSIPRSKLAEYLLPGLPPLAILAALGFQRLRTMQPANVRRLLGCFAALNAALALVGLACIPVLRRYSLLPTLENPPDVLAGDGVLLLLVLGMSGLIWWLRGLASRLVAIAVLGIALLITGVLAKTYVEATPMFSYRVLADVIAPQLEHGCVLASYHHLVQALPFYTGAQEKLVGYRGELAPFSDSPDAAPAFIASDAGLRDLWSAPSCVVLIVNRADLPKLQDSLNPAPILLGCEGKKLAAINRKPPVDISSPSECGTLLAQDHSRPR